MLLLIILALKKQEDHFGLCIRGERQRSGPAYFLSNCLSLNVLRVSQEVQLLWCILNSYYL